MIETITNPAEIENLWKTAANAPYTKVPSGFGYFGVLIKDSTTGNIQCHECGSFKRSLGQHLRWHGVKARDYKRKYGFPVSTPLCHEEYSRAHSEKCGGWLRKHGYYRNIKPGQKLTTRAWRASKRWAKRRGCMYTLSEQNKRNACKEQIYRRFILVADACGGEPKCSDIRKHDHPLLLLIYSRFGSLNAFRRKFGFQERVKPAPYTKDKVAAMIRDFVQKYKRIPTARYWAAHRNGHCTASTIKRHFGSWNRAMTMAGVVR